MRRGIQRLGLLARVSDGFWRSPSYLRVALMAAPVLWMTLIFLAPLLLLVLSSVQSDSQIPVSAEAFHAALSGAGGQAASRALVMGIAVTLLSILIAFPVSYYAARYARGWLKTTLQIGVMMPLWSSLIAKIYAWRLMLEDGGAISNVLESLGLSGLVGAFLKVPGVGGEDILHSQLAVLAVFTYAWLPIMIVTIWAALERFPASMIEASSDMGASALQTFRHVILPTAMPGILAGSIFTFSLTFGDFLVPRVLQSAELYLGQAVLQEALGGQLGIAAALAVVPLILTLLHIWLSNRSGGLRAF